MQGEVNWKVWNSIVNFLSSLLTSALAVAAWNHPQVGLLLWIAAGACSLAAAHAQLGGKGSGKGAAP